MVDKLPVMYRSSHVAESIFSIQTISIDSLNSLLDKLDTKKSMGPDSIHFFSSLWVTTKSYAACIKVAPLTGF